LKSYLYLPTKCLDISLQSRSFLFPQAKEAAFVEYLKACEGGKVPAKAPEARVREVFVAKEVIPLEGSGEGCANPNA